MNRQFHNKRQSLTVTDKYTGIGKLFDWSKNFTVDMFNIKLEEKSNKMSFKALSVKIQRSKNRQGGVGEQNVPAHPTPPLGQIGLNILEFLWYLFLELLLDFDLRSDFRNNKKVISKAGEQFFTSLHLEWRGNNLTPSWPACSRC